MDGAGPILLFPVTDGDPASPGECAMRFQRKHVALNFCTPGLKLVTSARRLVAAVFRAFSRRPILFIRFPHCMHTNSLILGNESMNWAMSLSINCMYPFVKVVLRHRRPLKDGASGTTLQPHPTHNVLGSTWEAGPHFWGLAADIFPSLAKL